MVLIPGSIPFFSASKYVMTQKLTFIFALLAMSSTMLAQPQYHIEGTLTGYDQDSIFLGYYFADKQYLIDTSRVVDGNFVFTGSDTLKPGVYLVVMPPDNKYFQIVVNESHPNFKMTGEHGNLEKTITFDDSPDNTLFYTNLRYISNLRQVADSLRNLQETAADEQDKLAAKVALDQLNKEVEAYQQELVQSNPEMLTSALIRSGFRVEIPDFEGTPEEIQNQQYLYVKKHYFDHVNLGDDRLIRCPQNTMYDRVNYYLDKLTPKHPDSINASIDYLLEKLEPAEDAYRTFLIKFLNDFAASKIVGMDAVYVHLVDKYYAQGKAPWVDETQLAKIIGNARTAKPTLIGKTAPDFTLQLRDSANIKLSDIKSPFTVLIFWAHDCNHCKETMPEIGKFQTDYQDKGVTVFSVCTKVLADEPKCWEFVDEREIGHLINASDMMGGKSFVRTLYNVRRTPKLFVLDEDKKILTKDLNVEQLYEYFETMIGPEEKGEEKE